MISIFSGVFLFIYCSHPLYNNRELTEKAYSPVDRALYWVILNQDSLLFEAFNSRNFAEFKSYFSEDLEIYQDNIGVRNYSQSMEAFQELFNSTYVLKRQLIKESVEVYPVRNYGAIETGEHTFCHTENDKPDCGTYKFVHIWKLSDGHWMITRIMTYNHIRP